MTIPFIGFQTLETAQQTIDTYVQSNSRFNLSYSLSGIFKHLRRQKQYEFIGDYPIISECVSYMKLHKFNLNRKMINNAINNSKELKSITKKEKMTLMDVLLDPERLIENFRVEAKLKTKKPVN